MPDWNSAIWILITLKSCQTVQRIVIPYFLGFSYLSNNSTSVPQLANHLKKKKARKKKQEAKARRRGWTKPGIYFVRAVGWVFFIPAGRKQTKRASLFFSLLVLHFGLSLIGLLSLSQCTCSWGIGIIQSRFLLLNTRGRCLWVAGSMSTFIPK